MTQSDLKPTLQGETVTLRPLREDDWPALFAAASDPLIWAVHPARDRYLEPVFRAFFDAAMASSSAFAILDAASGAVVGSSRYHGHDPERSEIEIGWTFLVRERWGGATNREVKRLMLDHAFGFVDTVVFWVGVENWRSRRAVEKIGGKLRNGTHHRKPSDGHTYVIYEIGRNDARAW